MTLQSHEAEPQHAVKVSAAGDGYEAARPSKILEIIFASVAVAFSVGYLGLTSNIVLRTAAGPGQMDAKLWPTIIGVTAVAVSLLLLVFAITKPAAGREDVEGAAPFGLVRVVLTLLITLGYVGLWGVGAVILLGYQVQLYPVVTAVYMVIMMLVFGHRKIMSLIAYPVCLTAFVYVVFGMLLRIPL